MSETPEKKHSPREIIKRLVAKLKANFVSYTEPSNETVEINNIEKLENTEELLTEQCGNQEQTSLTLNESFDEIQKFIEFIHDNKDINYLLYEYPYILQKRINIDVADLQGLLAEIKETVINIKKLRNQQKFIKKDILGVKRTIQRLKDNETRELESIVCRYDRDMYNRWIKAKWKSDALQQLMSDVQDKQLGLESLAKLIDRYLGKVKETSSLVEEDLEANDSVKDKLVPLSSSLFSFQSKIPVTSNGPCLPIHRPDPLVVNNRNNSRLSWAQRRFRAERRGNYSAVRPIMENREIEPSILSFNANNNENDTSAELNAIPFGPEFRTSRFSCSSNTISSRGSSNHTDAANNNERQNEDDTESKSDTQTVLEQTLFGNQIVLISINSADSDSRLTTEESNETVKN